MSRPAARVGRAKLVPDDFEAVVVVLVVAHPLAVRVAVVGRVGGGNVDLEPRDAKRGDQCNARKEGGVLELSALRAGEADDGDQKDEVVGARLPLGLDRILRAYADSGLGEGKTRRGWGYGLPRQWVGSSREGRRVSICAPVGDERRCARAWAPLRGRAAAPAGRMLW